MRTGKFVLERIIAIERVNFCEAVETIGFSSVPFRAAESS